MKFVVLILLIVIINNCFSMKIKNRKSRSKKKQYYYGAEQTYNIPENQSTLNLLTSQYFQSFPPQNFNTGYNASPVIDENYVYMQRTQTDKPIKIANVL